MGLCPGRYHANIKYRCILPSRHHYTMQQPGIWGSSFQQPILTRFLDYSPVTHHTHPCVLALLQSFHPTGYVGGSPSLVFDRYFNTLASYCLVLSTTCADGRITPKQVYASLLFPVLPPVLSGDGYCCRMLYAQLDVISIRGYCRWCQRDDSNAP